MAENESLDVGNRRFRWVSSAILRGLPATEIAQLAVKKLCAIWNAVRRNGFDPIGVLNLAVVGRPIDDAIRNTGGSDLAHLIARHAYPMNLPAGVLDAVNRSAIEAVIDSGLQKAQSSPNGPDVFSANTLKRQVMAAAEQAIASLTNGLLGGTAVRVRAPRLADTTAVRAFLIPPRALLQQSLLSVASRGVYGSHP